MVNIYVANIPFTSEEDGLRDLFAEYGEVHSVKIIKDRETGRSRGFGFVEMTDDEAGRSAIAQLNGMMLGGRELKVKEAYPREQRRPRY